MADLTARLGLTEGTNRVIDDPASPSGIGAALDFAKDAIAGYSSLKDDLSRKAQSRRAAEEKSTQARIAFDVTGAHDAARGDVMASQQARITAQQPVAEEVPSNKPLGSIFEEAPPGVSPAMERDIVGGAQKAMSVVTAVQQGRMPEITMNSALNARFRALREKYPEHTEYLLDTWKKTGLDTNLFTEGKDAADWHEYEREAQQKALDQKTAMEDTAISTAREQLGADALTMDRPALIIHGLNVMKQANDLKILSTQSEIQARTAGMTADAAVAGQKTLDEQIVANFNNQIYNGAGPVIRTVTGLVDSLLKNPTDPEALQRWQANGVRINQMIPQIAENALQQAIAAGYKGNAEEFKNRITSIYKPLTEAFTGDQSVVQANITTLKGIENSFQLNTAQALPIMMSLKAAGMKPAEMPAVIRAVETNPQLQKDLQAEMQGFVKDWGQDRASTHLMNMIKIFRGETTLRQMDGTASRTAVANLSTGIIPIAKNYVRGLDVDGMKVVHSVGELTVAASGLTPSSGSRSYLLATRAFAGEGTRQALIKTLSDKNIGGEDREMALATVQASRAGSARILNNVLIASERANAASPYFKMVWDRENGKYEIDRSGWRAAVANARTAVNNDVREMGLTATSNNPRGRLSTLQNMQPPEELTNLIKAGNVNLANAIELGQYDPSTPKATEKQLRNWYGRNVPIPGEKKAGPDAVDPQVEIDKQLDALDRMTTQTFDAAVRPVTLPNGAREVQGRGGQAVSVPSVNEIAAKYSGNGNYQAIVSTARELGIPAEIATRLGYVEGRFNDNMTPNGAGAMGPIQVVPKHHNPLAQQLFGKDVPELTPAQIIKVGLTFLKNNFEKYGNWDDAISGYHSGGPLSKRGNAHDGNISTRDYVKLIGG